MSKRQAFPGTRAASVCLQGVVWGPFGGTPVWMPVCSALSGVWSARGRLGVYSSNSQNGVPCVSLSIGLGMIWSLWGIPGSMPAVSHLVGQC